MPDSEFRGVVLGSSWRLTHRFLKFGPGATLTHDPAKDSYLGQSWAAQELLRRSLFYFDKIICPTNNLLFQGDTPDVDYLVSEGQVEREHIELPGPSEEAQFIRQLTAIPRRGLSGQIVHSIKEVAEFHRSVFDFREKQQPGAWSYAVVGEGLELAQSEIRPARGYSVALFNSLPVPSPVASYEDTIYFKKRERSALLDLRAHLDEMYAKISVSEDPSFIANMETMKLRQSIAVVLRLLNSAHLPYFMQSVEVEGIFGAASALLAGHDAGEYLERWGIPPDWARIAGGFLAAGLLVKRKEIQSPSRPGNPMYYLYAAGENGIIDKSPPP